VAIGSEGEIGKTFITGGKNIHYPWIVDGKQNQLMYGDSKLVYVKGREDNVYPPEGHDWEFSRGVFASPDNEEDCGNV
jgi:hypothetical protein